MTEHAPELDAPGPDVMADDHDQDGWDTGRHGRMRDHAAPDDAVPTVPWRPEED